mgnify:CR=1 FL=1
MNGSKKELGDSRDEMGVDGWRARTENGAPWRLCRNQAGAIVVRVAFLSEAIQSRRLPT